MFLLFFPSKHKKRVFMILLYNIFTFQNHWKCWIALSEFIREFAAGKFCVASKSKHWTDHKIRSDSGTFSEPASSWALVYSRLFEGYRLFHKTEGIVFSDIYFQIGIMSVRQTMICRLAYQLCRLSAANHSCCSMICSRFWNFAVTFKNKTKHKDRLNHDVSMLFFCSLR